METLIICFQFLVPLLLIVLVIWLMNMNSEKCQKVKRIEFFKNLKIKRIEFFNGIDGIDQ